MVRRFKKFDPQLVVVEHTAGSAIALTNEAKLSLYKKSQKSGIPTNVLETVYYRGYSIWNESFDQTPEQFAFDRVNSFIAGGFARDLDDDLLEEKRGLWDNIHAKRERIKNGSGEHMRKPGSKGAPTASALKNSQNEEALNELSPELIGKVNKARTIDGKPSKTATAAKTLNTAVKNAWAKTNVGVVKEERTTLATIKNLIREELDDNDTSRLKKFAKELKDKDAEIKVKTSVSLPPEEREKHPALELPTKYADRKAVAAKQTPSGVKKPDINGDIQREINSRLAPVLGGLKQKMDGKFRQNSISRMSEENND